MEVNECEKSELAHEWQNVFQPVAKTRRFQENRVRPSPSPGATVRKPFTINALERCFFLQNDVRIINIKMPAVTQQSECFWCDAGACSEDSDFQCPQHKNKKSSSQQTLPLALRSLPPEVGLCTSSIPGAGCGICARKKIPVGAWIGPYEGKSMKPEDLTPSTDTSYMWEIFKDGKLSEYIDGKDLNVTSWMRFIRCARHKLEQNLFAFQYLGRVFYRAFKDIVPGEEMLVWYDENYPQYLGIPAAIYDMGDKITHGSSPHPHEVIVVSPQLKRKIKYNQPLDTYIADTVFPSPPPSPAPNLCSPVKFTHGPTDSTSSLSLSPHNEQNYRYLENTDYSNYVPTHHWDISMRQNEGNIRRDNLKTNSKATIFSQRQKGLPIDSALYCQSSKLPHNY